MSVHHVSDMQNAIGDGGTVVERFEGVRDVDDGGGETVAETADSSSSSRGSLGETAPSCGRLGEPSLPSVLSVCSAAVSGLETGRPMEVPSSRM